MKKQQINKIFKVINSIDRICQIQALKKYVKLSFNFMKCTDIFIIKNKYNDKIEKLIKEETLYKEHQIIHNNKL